MLKRHHLSIAFALSGFCCTPAFAADELIINSMHSEAAPKKAFDAIVNKFKAENPNVKVTVNTVDHESYKVQMRTWLPNNPPDVCTWFAGNRSKYFVDKNLVEPIDDVWQPVSKYFSEGTHKAIAFNGHAYLMPASHYHWGFYYRKDLFQKAGITKAPTTWTDLRDAISKLKKQNITPFTIGTKQSWPAAAWFDLIDMRVNGYDFHMKLLNGEESYLNPKVKKAMGYWSDLVKDKAFPANAAAMTWQEGAALLWQGKAAMYLMGNFISADIPANMKDKIGFFGFPSIDPAVPLAQLAPMDIYFIPAKAKHKETAKKFLALLSRAESQQVYNDINEMVPPHREAKINPNNVFLAAGMKLLSSASGLSQFFDRDADPELAKVGMDGFVEFMSYPDHLDPVLANLERTRKRIYRK